MVQSLQQIERTCELHESFIEITDGLVPALQRRGLTRSVYSKSTLRETLKEF